MTWTWKVRKPRTAVHHLRCLGRALPIALLHNHAHGRVTDLGQSAFLEGLPRHRVLVVACR